MTKTISLHESDILGYLRANPDFFARHGDEIDQMRTAQKDVPQPNLTGPDVTGPNVTGPNVIDMAPHLAARARSEARNLRQAHQDLLHLASENMQHWQQLHHATLGFLACTVLSDFAQMVDEELPVIFGLSGARLVMPADSAIPEAESLGFLRLPQDEITALIAAEQVYLGPAKGTGSALFSVPSASMAVLALPDQLPAPIQGSALVLGGRSPDSFTPDMGQTFLTFLAEIVGVSLLALLESQ